MQLLSDIFEELVDCIIVDVASESHRIARLGLDHHLDEEEEELRLSAEARARASDSTHSGEANGKYVVDIFGQTHPAIAEEIIECMNCSRSVVAGRFAPHLEKCMGKVDSLTFDKLKSTLNRKLSEVTNQAKFAAIFCLRLIGDSTHLKCWVCREERLVSSRLGARRLHRTGSPGGARFPTRAVWVMEVVEMQAMSIPMEHWKNIELRDGVRSSSVMYFTPGRAQTGRAYGARPAMT